MGQDRSYPCLLGFTSYHNKWLIIISCALTSFSSWHDWVSCFSLHWENHHGQTKDPTMPRLDENILAREGRMKFSHVNANQKLNVCLYGIWARQDILASGDNVDRPNCLNCIFMILPTGTVAWLHSSSYLVTCCSLGHVITLAFQYLHLIAMLFNWWWPLGWVW